MQIALHRRARERRKEPDPRLADHADEDIGQRMARTEALCRTQQQRAHADQQQEEAGRHGQRNCYLGQVGGGPGDDGTARNFHGLAERPFGAAGDRSLLVHRCASFRCRRS